MQELPQAFEQRMKRQLGDEYPAFLASLSQKPPVSIRLNPLKWNGGEPQRATSVPWCEDAYYLEERPIFTLDPHFHAGHYYVQEASSMSLAQAVLPLLRQLDSPKVLDACAAPGGKSTLLASLMEGKGILLSNEVVGSRYHILRENMTKWSHPHTATCQLHPKTLGQLKGWWDIILVDAPCSGEGMFRKNPKAVGEWTEKNVAVCVARQEQILEHLIPTLRPGGFLIYSTCTFNPQENDDMVAWMMEHFPLEVSALTLQEGEGVLPTKYGQQCYMHKVKGEGFYMSLLQKTESKSQPWGGKKGKKQNGSTSQLDQKELSLVQAWVEDSGVSLLKEEGGKIIMVPESELRDFRNLHEALPYCEMGLEAGELIRGQFVPSHALALSGRVRADVPRVQLDKEQALAYLSRKPVEGWSASGKGWHLVQHGDAQLGWVKILPNRWNNHYPKEWRIRMTW